MIVAPRSTSGTGLPARQRQWPASVCRICSLASCKTRVRQSRQGRLATHPHSRQHASGAAAVHPASLLPAPAPALNRSAAAAPTLVPVPAAAPLPALSPALSRSTASVPARHAIDLAHLLAPASTLPASCPVPAMHAIDPSHLLALTSTAQASCPAPTMLTIDPSRLLAPTIAARASWSAPTMHAIDPRHLLAPSNAVSASLPAPARLCSQVRKTKTRVPCSMNVTAILILDLLVADHDPDQAHARTARTLDRITTAGASSSTASVQLVIARLHRPVVDDITRHATRVAASHTTTPGLVRHRGPACRPLVPALHHTLVHAHAHAQARVIATRLLHIHSCSQTHTGTSMRRCQPRSSVAYSRVSTSR